MLLKQATWGPRPGDVDAVKAMGKGVFLEQQFSAPISQYPDTLFDQPIEVGQPRQDGGMNLPALPIQ